VTVLDLTGTILTRCARELLCATGPDGVVLSAAGPWEELTGTPPEALAGRPLDDLVDEDGRAALRTCHEAVAAGMATGSLDVTVTVGDRSRVYDVLLRPVEGAVVASFRDVTQQRRAERQLGELNDRLQRTNEELTRSNEELQRFAYVASHDLSEPLRMVTSYCALLVSDYGAELDETAREYVAYAVDGALRMRTLIDDLLSYSRVSSVSVPAVEVDLAAVFDEAVRDLGPAIAGCGAQVTVGPMPAVLGNRGQLGQLAANLLGNALKFRTPGEVARVHVSAEEAGSVVTLSVSDNGIGIAEKHRQRIFVMFKRLHGRASYDGNGIGLALCQRIAELHGGQVWAEEAPDGGSVFRVTLVAAGGPGARAVTA
jgi:light-regulated signal transduction histidine kinase (bacteriophytochrome)